MFDDERTEGAGEGEPEEQLGNRFSLEDSKIASIPVLRTIIDGMLDIPYYQSS